MELGNAQLSVGSPGEKSLVPYDHLQMFLNSKSVIVILKGNNLLPGLAESSEVWHDHHCVYIHSYIL